MLQREKSPWPVPEVWRNDGAGGALAVVVAGVAAVVAALADAALADATQPSPVAAEVATTRMTALINLVACESRTATVLIPMQSHP